MDSIKVEALVQEFLAAQSLKILPQAPFGDAVNQFVSKDDKHAMEQFVAESLAGQVKDLLALDDDDENIESHMERYRAKLEAQFAAGQLKQARKRTFKPKPDHWDSDLDGHWEDQPEAIDNTPQSQATPVSAAETSRPRGRVAAKRVVEDEGDEDIDMDDAEEEDAPARKAPAKRGTTSRTTKTTTTKKAPAATIRKAPARGGGRKKANSLFIDDEDEDMFVDEDDEPAPPPARAPPKRAAASTTATRSGTRGSRQTKLDFSQSQRPAKSKASQPATLEISDDEISEDDAFESMPATRSRRR